ncbi:metallophosphoesterase family protein [Paracoccus subflavus]|uniref:metallophosphoesterase family protein n=1 Tax=Paracoccus subflavus TaxID=2528244 RepID=UPI0013EF02D1|nr:metallophosphoesterase [Paracoccus subflavus]
MASASSQRPLEIVQVSDTHLSQSHAWFTANWPVFLDEMRAQTPDLIVNSGDLSFNGPDNPEDLSFARAAHDALPAPWRAVAGNHDVGEAPGASRLNQQVDDRRLAAWRTHVGPSWWVHDLERDSLGLRLIGLDTALMGSGHPDEARQAAFVEAVLADRAGRPVLVFLHLPPFTADPEDRAITTQCLMFDRRRWLLNCCRTGGVLAIAAGHIHRHSVAEWDGMAVVTAPATSFVNVPDGPVSAMRPLRTGYLLWSYDGINLRHSVIRPRLFLSTDASNWTEADRTTTTLPPRPLAAALF